MAAPVVDDPAATGAQTPEELGRQLCEVAFNGQLTAERDTLALLERKADINYIDADRNTALLLASMTASRKVAIALIQHKADIHIHGEMGRVALHWACWRQCFDVVQELVSAGADLDARDQHDMTPLMWALAESDDYSDEIVEYLIQKRAQLDIVDSQHETALVQAAGTARSNAVTLLITHGADKDIRDVRIGE